MGTTSLGTLGGDNSRASDISSTGQAVGWSGTSEEDPELVSHAFITGPNGVGMTDLGTLDGTGSAASGINNLGQVVGESTIKAPTFTAHAFITGPNGAGMTDLGTLGGHNSYAFGINDRGQVVGYSETNEQVVGYRGMPSVALHAFITGANGVGMTDLGTLGGDESIASNINNMGQVAGYSKTTTGAYHAFITGANGEGMIDLGTLGGSQSFASGINAAGQVVGESQTTTGAYHAYITGSNGAGMTDLNSLLNLSNGPIFISAIGINNHGQVLAMGFIPELESYALMLAGLALVGFMVRCRKHIDREVVWTSAA